MEQYSAKSFVANIDQPRHNEEDDLNSWISENISAKSYESKPSCCFVSNVIQTNVCSFDMRPQNDYDMENFENDSGSQPVNLKNNTSMLNKAYLK